MVRDDGCARRASPPRAPDFAEADPLPSLGHAEEEEEEEEEADDMMPPLSEAEIISHLKTRKQ